MRRKTIAALALLALSALAAVAADQQLWQVGECDGSYAEFAMAGHYERYPQEFGSGAAFEIGKGDPSKDWVYVQPGVDDKWAGWEGEHPFEVIFNLDYQPTGPHVVTVGLVDVSPSSPPNLRIRVNEKSRSYQLEPGASEQSLTDPSKGRRQEVKMYFAGGYLQKGRNVVNLTITKGSWVLYDCISLSTAPAYPHLAEGLVVVPRYHLFRKCGGDLKQIVQASMEIYSAQRVIRAVLTDDAGLRVEQEFQNVESGWRTLEIEIPPVKKAQKAHVKLFVGPEDHEAECIVRPEKQWKIYMMPSTHFDLGYNMLQDEALKLHRDNTDRAIDWAKKYPDFIWNLEGSYTAEDYLARGGRKDDFLAIAKRGGLGVTGFYGNELTGICSSEGLSRLIDYYDFLRRKYGIESKCAMQNDVPTMVASVPMILAGHGIKYLSHGTNTTRAGGGQEFDRIPYYWESPDGSRVLMWKVVGNYAQSADVTGLDDGGTLQLAADRIAGVIAEFEGRGDYPYDAILLHGAYGDNWPNGPSLADIPALWNAKYEYPKLIFCRGSEFFEYIEKNFKQHIKTVKGDGGVWWEDGAASSARETGISRIAKEKLVTAEKLASLCGVAFQKKLQADFAEAWKNALLYDEHTWGADISMSHPEDKKTADQWAVKKSFADKAAALADKLLDNAMSRFCEGIQVPQDSLVVFNPSSWPRSEWIQYKPDDARATALAESVPPLGYKVVPLPSQTVALNSEPGDQLENRYYTVTFDKNTGAVKSIYDKELGRELVDASTYGLNSYLYVSGGEESAVLDYSDKKPDFDIVTCANASFEKYSNPLGVEMRIRSTAPNARSCVSRVILYNDQKRIDFITDLDKILTYKKEAGYFAFPFAFTNPKIRLEIPNAVIRPELDQFPGACRDWYAVQHFLTLADDGAAVAWTALDSPLVTLQDINRGQWYRHLKIENGSVFAYVFSNYWWTNYKAGQDGPHTFRFSMTSARSISDPEAKRFGEAAQNPLVWKILKGKGRANAAAARSFVEVEENGVVLQAMLPARFWEGTIIRLREMSGKTVKARLKPNGITFKKAYLCNLAEDKQGALPVKDGTIEVPCKALGLATVLLER